MKCERSTTTKADVKTQCSKVCLALFGLMLASLLAFDLSQSPMNGSGIAWACVFNFAGEFAQMNVLIIFATVEGQTGKIAGFVEQEVRKANHDVVSVDISDAVEPVSFEDIDKVILAAPVHERRHPMAFEIFLSGRQSELADLQTLLISVSLSAAFPEGFEEANEYVIELKMRTGFSPEAEALVAGAVRSTQYDYFAREVVRHVVLRGRDYDPTLKDHEFTDWQALSATLADFLATPATSETAVESI